MLSKIRGDCVIHRDHDARCVLKHVWMYVSADVLACLVQHNPNAVLVSHKQKGNPVLKHIANVRKEFSDIVPDYMIGANSCALFLSLRCWSLITQHASAASSSPSLIGSCSSLVS